MHLNVVFKIIAVVATMYYCLHQSWDSSEYTICGHHGCGKNDTIGIMQIIKIMSLLFINGCHLTADCERRSTVTTSVPHLQDEFLFQSVSESNNKSKLILSFIEYFIFIVDNVWYVHIYTS